MCRAFCLYYWLFVEHLSVFFAAFGFWRRHCFCGFVQNRTVNKVPQIYGIKTHHPHNRLGCFCNKSFRPNQSVVYSIFGEGKPKQRRCNFLRLRISPVMPFEIYQCSFQHEPVLNGGTRNNPQHFCEIQKCYDQFRPTRHDAC